jgi:hypothetical protein
MTRADQFACIDQAQVSVLTWAQEAGIPLHRVEFVVPFISDDFSLSAWFFYETEDQLRGSEQAGWSAVITSTFTRALQSAGYAEEWLREVNYMFDSHEHVVRDYEGSYFYRLR